MALIEETIRITATVAPPGESIRDFGRGLYLHRVSAVVTDRGEAELIRGIPAYATASALEADSPGDAIVAAGRAWFAAEPHPRNLLVGTQIAVAQPTYIFSGTPGSVVEIEALGDTVALNLNGNAFTADFDGLATYDLIADALETGVQTVTAYGSVTVAHDGTQFVFTGGIGFSFGDGFSVTAASDTLGLTAGASVLMNVPAAEAPDEALTRLEALDASFFWMAVAPNISQDYALLDSVRDWAAARRLQVGLVTDVFGPDVLVPAETTSIGAQLSAQMGDGITAIYNGLTVGAIDLKALRYAGRFSSVNFNQPGGDINGKFLTLSGAVATSLTSGQRAELTRKRINWYVPAGNSAATGEGQTFGTWIDVYYFLSWFATALRTAAWNHLRSSAGLGGTPLTDPGLASIVATLAQVCEQGVRFGALAPNVVSPVTQFAIRQATGNEDFDGVLSTGYLIVPPRVSDLSQTVRDTRSAIPIKIFAKGSGKVNNLDIAITLEN